jgi:Mce-associated membrane protein
MSKHSMPEDGNITEWPEETVIDEAQESTEKSDEPTDTTEETTSATEESADTPEEPTEESADTGEPTSSGRRIDWPRVVAYGVLPALALLLAMGAGYLKWMDNSASYGVLDPASNSPASQSMQVAKDSTIAMLSYKPDSVEQQLNGARELLTGDFRDQYTSLINDVVIPGAKQKQISAVASVPAVASVSADPNRAVVLVFVNQTVVVGQDPPTDTASSVRVTLDKVGDRWLIAQFDPV